MVSTAAVPTSGGTHLPCDGGYYIFRLHETFEAWGSVKWWTQWPDQHKDSELGRSAIADQVVKEGLKVWVGLVNRVRENARRLGWAH